jgi:cell division protein FtsB
VNNRANRLQTWFLPAFSQNFALTGEVGRKSTRKLESGWPADPSNIAMVLKIGITGGWFHRMRRVLATLCIGVLAVFIGYKVMFGANGMKVYEGKRAEVVRLQHQIDQEKIKNEELRRQVDGLQREDPNAIEKEAREQLGYVKPGEVVLVEPQHKPDTKRAPTVAENTDQN